MTRSRIVWWLETDAAEDGGEHHVYMTKGWLEESDMLRWTLTRALTTEGTHNGWFSATGAADSAEIRWAEDEQGQPVTVAHVSLEAR